MFFSKPYLDAIKAQRKKAQPAQSAGTEKTTPDMTKMAESPEKKPAAKKKKEKKDKGGLYSKSRAGFLLDNGTSANSTATEPEQNASTPKKKGHQKPSSSSKKKKGKKRRDPCRYTPSKYEFGNFRDFIFFLCCNEQDLI